MCMKAVFTHGECWRCITRLKDVGTRSIDYRVAEAIQILPVEQRLRALCRPGKEAAPAGSSRDQAGNVEHCHCLPCQFFHGQCIVACNLDDTELSGRSWDVRKTNASALIDNNYREHLW